MEMCEDFEGIGTRILPSALRPFCSRGPRAGGSMGPSDAVAAGVRGLRQAHHEGDAGDAEAVQTKRAAVAAPKNGPPRWFPLGLKINPCEFPGVHMFFFGLLGCFTK